MLYRVFESWRLIAAILVMLYHFLRYAPAGHEWISHWLFRLLPLMDMFLMISGFLIMMRYEPEAFRRRGFYADFLMRRIARFYPLYLATLLFFVGVAIAVHLGFVQTLDPDRYAWSALLQNVLLVQAWGTTHQLTFNYVAWTLSAEWFCYLLFPLFVVVFRRGGLAGLATLAVLTTFAMEAATASGAMPNETWFHADTHAAPRAFADFALGALVAMAVRQRRPSLTSPLSGWGAFALAIAAMIANQNPYLVLLLLVAAMYLSALAEPTAPKAPPGRAAASRGILFGIYLIQSSRRRCCWPLPGDGSRPPDRLRAGPAGAMILTITVAMFSDRHGESCRPRVARPDTAAARPAGATVAHRIDFGTYWLSNEGAYFLNRPRTTSRANMENCETNRR